MTASTDLVSLLGHRPHSAHIKYGTAGFRGPATTLYEAILRCGVLAACRSHVCEKTVGAMITASHNPAEDNGIKLVDPDGSMLAPDWEPVATRFVNASEHILAPLADIVSIDRVASERRAVVIVGIDTRPSAPVLLDLFVQGVEALGGTVIKLGVVTTPQLHVAVRGYNARDAWDPQTDYFAVLSTAFTDLAGEKGPLPALTNRLVVDCANGVGAPAMSAVQSVLPTMRIVNKPGDGPLNKLCGADFVQKKRVMPKVYGDSPDGDLWASLDGDADRLVFFQRSEAARNHEQSEDLVLADGDRFAGLLASFITKHLTTADVTMSVAVAQTAYSNGAATAFLESLDNVDVVIAKTGVKYLERAIHPYDIGIYWEPNGHGTVLFATKTIARLEKKLEAVKDDEGQTEVTASLRALLAVSKLANQAVGDGVADLLLVIAVLSRQKMTFNDWLQIYDERCSCNLVVRVEDKSVVQTTDCDRVVASPEKLTTVIEGTVTGDGCRAFVRPSGTEDIVRVYAEAPYGCEGKAKEMAFEIARAVYDICSGVGDRP